MNASEGDVVVPGDVVQLPAKSGGKLILGPGLMKVREEVHVTKCGVLRKGGNHIYYVDSRQKKYVPAKGECVLGVVTNARGEMFRVDIGSSDEASVSYLAFENATKKNRPLINVGDVIFGKLLVASKDMEPELVCVDSHGKKGRLGVLPEGGFLFSCSLNLVRKILKPTCPLLETLGKELAYEVVVGMNGMVWVRTNSVRETILVCNAILNMETLENHQIEHAVQELVYQLSSC
ncbi:exosome complex component RRP40 [Neocloeon triangulifer]|uniref:exosome complex component RRP40 n=1 Tax=Neocloeon triangulifer TaxID=2078957 RepID=UPI00286F0874|nr:exosome complex component RRP40 [Neocloeon triangulifer]